MKKNSSMKKKVVSLAAAAGMAMMVVTASPSNVFNPSTTAQTVHASSWLSGYVLAGTNLYSQPYSDCYAAYVATKSPAKFKLYSGNWWLVQIGGRTYYVYGQGHLSPA